MTDHTISAPARTSLATFTGYLASRHSPALGEAGAIYDRCVSLGVDPAVALGFFDHESACGTRGRAAGLNGDGTPRSGPPTRSWGNLRWLAAYDALPYPVTAVDGFCGYQNFTDAADHWCRHLVGQDGTNFYAGRGLRTVSQVVPVYAPAGDGNSPDAYIAAVNATVDGLTGGTAVAKPRVLLVAGHNSIDQITADHLPGGQSEADALRGSTGSHGEREWTGNAVQVLAGALNATGQVDASFTDAIWRPAVYDGQHYDLIIFCHYHRDADSERAMFAAPATVLIPTVITGDARAQAQRFVDRLVGGYTKATGILVSEPLITLNMTELYSYSYPDSDDPMVCVEFGNANLDAAVLYEPGITRIAKFLRDCVLEHLNLTPVGEAPPARRTTDTPPPPPPVAVPQNVQDAAALRAIANRLNPT